MGHADIYRGQCFCGAVQFTLSGQPAGMGYCHCDSCRRWSASPVNAFTLWKPGALHVTHGAEHIGIYNKTAHSYRKWCRLCGGHLFNEHPGLGLIDVYAAVVDDLAYEPCVHVHYPESVLPMNDRLPKFRDLPGEMGGSGISAVE